MKIPIKFYYHKHLIYLFIRALCFGLRKVIEILYFEQSMPLFLMFIGESLSIFLYLFNNIFLLQKKENINGFIIDENKTNNFIIGIKIYLMILICSLSDLIGCYNFKIIGSNKTNFKNNFNMIFLCIFIALNEHIYLKIQSYNYHKLGYILYFISLIIDLLININEFNKSLLFILIISLESQYIESLFYIIEKKLNYEHYIQISYICFLEGIFGIILIVIFYYTSLISEPLIPKGKNDVLIIILYLFLTCIANLCRLRVTEISRPSYNLIGKNLCTLSIDIVSSIFEDKNKKYKWNITNILIMVFSLIGAFIYCEVITLHFLNLDKYITNNIIDRGNRETIEMISFANIEEE